MRRARIFAARGGICGDATLGDKDWGCGRKLRIGEDWNVEHHPALENGGVDDDEHCYVACEWCRPDKDGDDHRAASKSKRIYTFQNVPARFRKSKAWGRR